MRLCVLIGFQTTTTTTTVKLWCGFERKEEFILFLNCGPVIGLRNNVDVTESHKISDKKKKLILSEEKEQLQ